MNQNLRVVLFAGGEVVVRAPIGEVKFYRDLEKLALQAAQRLQYDAERYGWTITRGELRFYASASCVDEFEIRPSRREMAVDDRHRWSFSDRVPFSWEARYGF